MTNKYHPVKHPGWFSSLKRTNKQTKKRKLNCFPWAFCFSVPLSLIDLVFPVQLYPSFPYQSLISSREHLPFQHYIGTLMIHTHCIKQNKKKSNKAHFPSTPNHHTTFHRLQEKLTWILGSCSYPQHYWLLLTKPVSRQLLCFSALSPAMCLQ